MSVKMRQHVERQIARRFIMDAKAAGYTMNVDNGGDEFELPEPTNNVKLLLDTMFATDDERLYLFLPGKERPVGWVWFVYGNSGWDVISDYTTNLQHVMDGASKLAEKWS